MSWLRFVGRRVATAALTLVALSVFIFWATEQLPGDAAGVLSGPNATEQERALLRDELGLHRPAAERCVEWITQAARGDLGVSLLSGRPVGEIVASRVGNTLGIVVIAMAIVALTAAVAGTVAGVRAGSRLDGVISAGVTCLTALPDFLVAAFLLTIFAVLLRLSPGISLVPIGESPWQHPDVLLLPVASLVLAGLGGTTRMLRAGVVAVMASPYAEHARLNGAAGPRLALRHVLPNALGPAVQAMAIMSAGLLGGGVVVETLFDFPGIGNELTDAVASRDVPVVQGISLVLGALSLAILLVGDLAARGLDPAKRRGGGR